MAIMTDAPEVGRLLRGWRERRHLTQLQLALTAEVSTKHLSFLETGRSRPTRDMIDRLAAHMDVPLREHNELLLAAGFAPRYGEHAFGSPELAAISDSFRLILDAHSPHPALVLDRRWDVVDSNAATDTLLAGCAPELLDPPANAIRISLHPGGLAPRIRNLAQWRAHLLGQLRARLERTGDAGLRDLLDEVAAYPSTGDGTPGRADVVVPLRLDTGDEILSFFSISSAVVSATDVTVDELHIEAFYPADEATARALRSR